MERPSTLLRPHLKLKQRSPVNYEQQQCKERTAAQCGGLEVLGPPDSVPLLQEGGPVFPALPAAQLLTHREVQVVPLPQGSQSVETASLVIVLQELNTACRGSTVPRLKETIPKASAPNPMPSTKAG